MNLRTKGLKNGRTKIILALDVDSFDKAKRIVDKLYPEIKIFKVGVQLFTACGPKIVEYINNKGAEVFLDLKYFDIPNTVAGAVAQAVRLKVKMLTLHILGDADMLSAAHMAARRQARLLGVKKPLLIGVTVLTSKETTSSDVLTLGKIGIDCGLDGLVCSAREVTLLRREIKNKFLIVTPGIRPEGSIAHDQKRTASVRQATQAGSNFLVIGRPILEAKDPLEAARQISRELNSVL
ncbi:MAG: orotidine-5'-phosphate decarboxylase [Candidatus Omnitrophica bacterium]|nr:orotidine-5'-phosphate decarboxylase [Candidatus Omnitrophota bacterium]